MGVRLTPEEIDGFLEKGHTLIFTTVDKDGYPHSTPLWYVYMDGHIYTRTLKKSQKAKNVERDPKVCCLVETGERWVDLESVVIRGRAELVQDQATKEKYEAGLGAKYAEFRAPLQKAPSKVQQHYAQERVYYKIVPEKRIASWYNQKVRLGATS